MQPIKCMFRYLDYEDEKARDVTIHQFIIYQDNLCAVIEDESGTFDVVDVDYLQRIKEIQWTLVSPISNKPVKEIRGKKLNISHNRTTKLIFDDLESNKEPK